MLEDARAPLRLARELRDGDVLGAEAIARTVEALHDFKAVADGPARPGSSRSRPRRSARRSTARTSCAPRAGDRHPARGDRRRDSRRSSGSWARCTTCPSHAGVTMDVGGGSVELTRFEDRRPGRSWTVPFGSLRASDRFLDHDPPTDEGDRAPAACADRGPRRRRRDRTPQARGPRRHRRHGPQPGEGRPAPDRRRDAAPSTGTSSRRADLAAMIDDLAERSMKRRALVAGPQPRPRRHDRGRRARGARGDGARRGVDRLMVSSRGIREGLALDSFGREVPPASWVRTDLGRHARRAGSPRGTPRPPNAGRRSPRRSSTRSTRHRRPRSARC